MANTTRYHGVGVNFGINTGVSTVTGLFQTRDQSFVSEAETIKNGIGDTYEKTFYDLHQTATFEFVATGAGPSGTVPVIIPSVGDIITVTDTIYTQIAGTNWMVDGIDSKGSNTAAVRVTLKLTEYPNITA